MEILTYSLWFTLIWLVFMLTIWNVEFERRDNHKLTVHIYLVPTIAILLEYLIVR